MKKIAHIGTNCVACGACMFVCPRKAISIPAGTKAIVNHTLCVGCSKCEKTCPAGIITMQERVTQNAK